MTPPYRFSIFLPVRNGGQYFRQCINSILNQKYRDFELVVLDNNSTDGSLDWVQSLGDSRIKIYDSDQTLSIEESWGRIVDLPKHEFMTITGHDDLFDPNYLDIMCRLIGENPDAALYQGHFRLIGSDGKKIRSCVQMPTIEKADGFLESRLSFRRDSFGTGYMYRSSDYEKVGGIPLYKKLLFADDALWIQLMKDSYKATADAECFSYRVHASSTSYSPDWRATFEALGCYLKYLDNCSKNQSIRKVLYDKLGGYVIFWFQWAYFSTAKNRDDRRALEIEMNRLHRHVEKILPNGKIDFFDSDVQRRVYGKLAYFHWIGWRACKWIERRTLGSVANLS